MRYVILSVIVVSAFLAIIPVGAQDPAVCPSNALLSYVRAGAVCQETGRDEICMGNGIVSATFQGDVVPFETAGDVIPAGAVEIISVNTLSLDQPDYGIATMRLRADLTDPEQRAVAVLLFGNAAITNGVPPVTEIRVVARGTLNIRALPDPQANILEQIFVRESVFAHGRTEDGAWLRVNIPGTLRRGWVSAEVGAPEGDVSALPVMDNDTPFLRPFQVMSIETNSDAGLCGENIADGGVLLQTPNPDDQVTLTINDTELGIAGTVFIEANDDTTRFSVLEGIVNIGGVFAPAGTEITLDGTEAVPLQSRERLLALPVNNLPTRVQIPAPATPDEIEARILAYNATVPTPIPTPTIPANICRYMVRSNNTALRAGPGGFYETINELNAGVELTIVLQNTDADGNVWYQLRNSNWIAASAVSQSGGCNPIPVTDFVAAPRTNTVQMETCEASNGPLREGQIVTFEFRPPAADNYPEMERAPQIDPGRLRVENEALRVRYTDPILIASDPERWARVYSATWEAKAGTYRVESARLSYILICELTVRAG